MRKIVNKLRINNFHEQFRSFAWKDWLGSRDGSAQKVTDSTHKIQVSRGNLDSTIRVVVSTVSSANRAGGWAPKKKHRWRSQRDRVISSWIKLKNSELLRAGPFTLFLNAEPLFYSKQKCQVLERCSFCVDDTSPFSHPHDTLPFFCHRFGMFDAYGAPHCSFPPFFCSAPLAIEFLELVLGYCCCHMVYVEKKKKGG